MNSFIWKNPANAGGGGNITQLEQEVQKLQAQLQQIGTQIQNLTRQLAQKAGKAEENNFTAKQKISMPNKALTFTQDNNATYISFERADGTRRGYVGMGSSGSNKIHLNGDDGIQISSTTGDLELNPAGSITANNKPILNVGASNDADAALTLNKLKTLFKTDIFMGVGPNAVMSNVITLTHDINTIVSYLVFPATSTSSTSLDLQSMVTDIRITGPREVTITWGGTADGHFQIWYI